MVCVSNDQRVRQIHTCDPGVVYSFIFICLFTYQMATGGPLLPTLSLPSGIYHLEAKKDIEVTGINTQREVTISVKEEKSG